MSISRKNKIQLSGQRKPQLERTESLKKLFNDIRPYKSLTEQETNDLFNLYHSGTEAERRYAFEKIYKYNIRLVISMARDYCSSADNVNDLIQEGNIGLMKAIEKYDMEQGSSFAKYALYWIRRYINVFKSNLTPIVAQTNRSKTTSIISNIAEKLYNELERTPLPDEILERYNTEFPKKPIGDIEDIINVEYIYIDNSDPEDTSNRQNSSLYTYNSISANDNEYMSVMDKEHNKAVVEELMSGLTKNEQRVIRRMFGLDDGISSNLTIVSSEMGVSKQRINQLYKKAIKKMREKSKELEYSYC